MELSQAILGRRTVREYTSEPVSKETIERLIAAAIQAPSAMNEQPWSFTVVRDRNVLDALARDAKTHALASLPPSERSQHLATMLADPDFHIFYHAPALIVIVAAGHGPWAIEDCALAAENMMLAAYGEGLGSGWIGFAQGYLNTSAGKSLLGLASESVPVAPIIVGHAKAPAPAVPRKDPVIRWLG